MCICRTLFCLRSWSRTHAIQYFLSGIFPADKGFVGPDVKPISVAAAIGNADIVQISMHLAKASARSRSKITCA